MRIRKIDLYGFKSFPDRTTLVLDDGISCVVGPNGCGKSNIVDAVKWCVGEQSVRSLRGGEMSDVIFAGSADRPPVGYAEVALTFTSEGGEPFPGEHASQEELQIGRRLHRSGTSEYLINQERVRRRDVVELFLDTGVGNNLYSVIEQGRIGKIVHASHDERRMLIDEAAGISRYKHKRDESSRRLEATAAQLDRAADVAEEMGRRLRTLERQVIKAERFRRLRARLRQEEIALSLARYAALSADRRALRRDLHQCRAALAGADRELARVRADLQLRRDEIASAEGAVDTWRDEVAEQDARRRELEGERSWLGRELEGLDQREVRERQELARAAGEVEEAGERARAVEEEARAARGEIAALAGTTERVEAEAARAREALGAARALLDAVGTELAGATARLEAATARQAELDKRLAAESGPVPAVVEKDLERLRDRVAEGEAAVAVARELETGARRALLDAEGALAEARLTQALAEQGALEALHAAEAASEADIRAAEEAHREAGAALQAALDARLAQAAAGVEAEALRRAAEDRDRLRTVEQRAAARAEALRSRLDAEEHAAEVRRAEAEAAARALGEGAREAGRHLDGLRARRLGVAEHLAALERLAAGTAEVRAALGLPLLADLLPLDRAEELAPVLGERLLAPVATRAEQVVAALDIARDTGPAAVLWSPDGDPVEGVLEHTRIASTLHGALDARGTTVATRDGEVRVEADGLVRLGRASAEDAVRSRRELESLDQDITGAEDRLRGAVAEAEAAAAGLAAFGEQRSAWQIERRQRIEADRREADAERARLEGELRAEAAGRRHADARVLTRAREEGEAALARDRLALDAALDEARRGARGAVAAARALLDERRLAGESAGPGHRVEGARRDESEARQAHEEARRSLRAHQRALASREADLARTRVSELDEDRLGRQGQVQAAGEVLARAEAERTRVHGEAAALEERSRSLAAAASAHRERGGRAQERRAALDAVLEDLASTRSARQARQVEVEALLGQLQGEYGQATQRLARERARLEGLRAGVRSAEARAEEQEARRSAMAQRAGELEGRVAEVRTALDDLKGRMDERYQVSLAGLLDRIDAQGSVDLEPDPRLTEEMRVGRAVLEAVPPMRLDSGLLDDEERILALVDRARQHRRKVDAAGELNLAAVEEYREVFGRHRELELQRADLEESVTRIRAAIARMNRLCRQRFRDTFERVDEHFRDTYPTLVGGGSARLALTDEDDLLETGVEILVQPPGKRLQNLHLLSGGEKAMTAIALILALFRVKPAPFCIMDEVDAPLDEANGARFNEMLREMSAVSQFILVSHNRRTMGYADVLYGVTMPTPGVSRLVSVRVDE